MREYRTLISPKPENRRAVNDLSFEPPRCRCVWLGVRCPNPASQEDGLCDWCAPVGSRTQEQLRANPNAMIAPDGTYLGLGGRGETHDQPLAEVRGFSPAACWYDDSGRTLA